MSKESKRRYSNQLVDGIKKAPSRAMLRAVGFTEPPGRYRLPLEHGHPPAICTSTGWPMRRQPRLRGRAHHAQSY